MTTVRVCVVEYQGDDPLLWETADVLLPEGYGRVWRGRVREGDRHFNRWSIIGEIVDGKRPEVWRPVFPLPPNPSQEDQQVGSYYVVIRPGAVDTPACERCGHQARVYRRGYVERYCGWCSHLVRKVRPV